MLQDCIRFGFDERLISIIPHGNYDIYHHVDNAGEAKKPEQGRVLLFGRMIRYKGLEILVQAAPIIAAKVPDLKIVLAGRGPELDRLLPEIEHSPLFEIHNRFIDPAEVKTFFTRASVIVLPYFDATQSGPLHLAFSFGRPVVASRVGAMPEALAEGVEGLLVEPGDPAALAQKVIQLLSDPDKAMEMGREGRKKAQDQLNWSEKIADQTKMVYLKAIEQNRNRKDFTRPGFIELYKMKTKR